MAIYHLHVGIISRSSGRSSVAAAAYRAGEKLYSEHDDLTHNYSEKSNSVNAAAYRSGEELHNEQGGAIYDYTRKRGVVYTEIMLPENAPREFEDRGTLWNAVEKSEKRRDAQTAREIDIAFPIELDRQEQIEIMQQYIKENFVNKGMCADFAIHDKGDGNPHAHILLTTRNVDEKGFKNKNRDWNKPEYLKQWRENWANICNETLHKKEFPERIDHRTLKAQGIDREPTTHRGVAVEQMERKGIDTKIGREHREIVKRNHLKTPEYIAEHMHQLKNNYVIFDKEITALKQETAKARREIESLHFHAEQITERAEYINTIKTRLDGLKAERQKMGFFKSKKKINNQIKQFENSHNRAVNSLKFDFNVTSEEVPEQIQRLEDKAKDQKQLQERLKNKAVEMETEKEAFAFKYRRQRLFAEVSPERGKIFGKLEQLEKKVRIQTQSPYYALTQIQRGRELDVITKRQFQEILKEMRPEQAKLLTELRDMERLREQTTALEIGMILTPIL